MSLIAQLEKRAKGSAKPGKPLSKRAFAKLADALGIAEDRRDEAESALRLYMHLSSEDED